MAKPDGLPGFTRRSRGRRATETVALVDSAAVTRVFAIANQKGGVAKVNGLTAANEVLVPLQCEALGHRGVAQLLETIADVREFTNPRLRVRGVIATMFDARGRHAREVLDDVQTRFGLSVLGPPIPKTVRFAEAPGRGVSILEHAPQSAGAQAYPAIAEPLHAHVA